MNNSSPTPTPTPTTSTIKLNIGGTLIETTQSTLTNLNTTFIDRDPSLFTPLLTLLRTSHLPSSTLNHTSPHDLLTESSHYNLTHLITPHLSPLPLYPPSLSLHSTLSPPLHPSSITSLSPSPSSLLLSHSNLLSFYHPTTLHLIYTFPTHVPLITSLTSSPTLACIGSLSSPGLHLCSLSSFAHVGSVFWTDPQDPRTHHATVTCIVNKKESENGNCVFAGFESRHGETAVLEVDVEKGKVVGEMGRSMRGGVKRLKWVESVGVLVGSSVSCTAFGYSGFVKAWDPRVGGREVWEVSEPGGGRIGDGMAGVDVDEEGGFVAKVCSKSGDLGLMDLRKVGGKGMEKDGWVYVEERDPSVRGERVFGRRVEVCCYKGNVFVGRDGALEVWSRVGGEGVYRRYYVDKAEDESRGVIRMIQGGGDRLFVCRENVEGVEVWQSSNDSGVRQVAL